MSIDIRAAWEVDPGPDWVPCPLGGDAYAIHPEGIIRRVRRGPGARLDTFMRGSVLASGHRHITLRVGGRSVRRYMHQLVALAFIGPPPGPGYEVDHINRDPADNRVGNLRWVTHKQNQWNRGGQGKINGDSDIPLILHMMQDGKTQAVIAKHFGVSQPCINRVANRARRGAIDGMAEAVRLANGAPERPAPEWFAKLGATADAIVADYQSDEHPTMAHLAERYSLKVHQVSVVLAVAGVPPLRGRRKLMPTAATG